MPFIETLFRTTAITFEFFRAIHGTPAVDIHANALDKSVNLSIPDNRLEITSDEPPPPTIWDCPSIAPDGSEIPGATTCILTTDKKSGDPTLSLLFNVPDGQTGPSFAFAPIAGVETADGVGLALLTFAPTPGINSSVDLACHIPQDLLGSNQYSFFSQAGLENRNECVSNFTDPTTVTMLGSDGQEHEVTFQPTGGDTGFVRFKRGTPDGPIFLVFGGPGKETYIPLSLFEAVSEQIDEDMAGKRVTEFLYRTPIDKPDKPEQFVPPMGGYQYPKINLPPNLIDQFRLTHPQVESEPTPSLSQSTTSVSPGAEGSASTLSPETIVVPEQRLFGPQEVTTDISCLQGDRITGYEADQDSPAAIALYMAATQPGWHPEKIEEAMVSIRKEFKSQKPPNFIEKLFGAKEKPQKIHELSCNEANLHLTLEPLTEILDNDGNTVIVGIDKRTHKMIYLVIPAELGPDRVKTEIKVNGTIDHATTAEISRQWILATRHQQTGEPALKWGTVIVPANSSPLIPSDANLADITTSTAKDIPYSAYAIDRDGNTHALILPTSLVTKPIGRTNIRGVYYDVLAVNRLDLAGSSLFTQAYTDLQEIYKTDSSIRFIIMIPILDAYSSYDVPVKNPSPAPTPQTHRQQMQRSQELAFMRLHVQRQLAKDMPMLTPTL